MSILLLCALVSAALAGMGYLAQVPVALVFVPLALLGLFGGVLSLAAISFLIGTTTVGLSRWLIRRRLIAGLPHSQNRTVRWTFTDEGFHVQTADKTSQVPWTAIRRVLMDPDFWFLQVHDGLELVLPVVNLSAEVRDLICKRAAVLPPASLQMSHAFNDQGAGVVGAVDSHGGLMSLQPGSPWGPLPERPTLEGIRGEGARTAAYDGQLPDKLHDVTEVPLPNDPGTGKPFEYSRDGDTATLVSQVPGDALPKTGLRYRVTIQKK
jgi:hypothetical protein